MVLFVRRLWLEFAHPAQSICYVCSAAGKFNQIRLLNTDYEPYSSAAAFESLQLVKISRRSRLRYCDTCNGSAEDGIRHVTHARAVYSRATCPETEMLMIITKTLLIPIQ